MIYLIESSSYRLLNNEINKIVKGNQYETFDLTTNNLEDVLSELSYQSIFLEKRYIIIRNADIFSVKDKGNNEALVNFLSESDNPNIVIFTTYLNVDERKKITKIIKDKHHFIKIKIPVYNELNKNLKQYLKSKQIMITDDALNFIINSCNNNYDIILNELDKIALLDIPNITLEIVKKTCSHILNDNNFKLLDAIIAKNISLAMNLFNEFKIKRQEPMMLLVLLAREYRYLYLIKKFDEENYSESKMMEKLGLASWQISKYYRSSFNYTLTEIEDNIISLANVDYQIKSGKISSSLGLEMFILKNL